MRKAAEFKTPEEALEAKVSIGAVADRFQMSRRDVQILRYRLGLIKPGPMYDHWTRVIDREGLKPSRISAKKTGKKQAA